MSRGRNRSLILLLELPLELTNQLYLLLDNKVSGPDIREEGVAITVDILSGRCREGVILLEG